MNLIKDIQAWLQVALIIGSVIGCYFSLKTEVEIVKFRVSNIETKLEVHNKIERIK